MRGIIVVARNRTGTNWLRNILGNATNGVDLGEVLHPTKRPDGNFFNWAEADFGQIPAERSYEWTLDVLTRFYDFLEDSFPVPIVDVKYSSFGAFGPSWYSPAKLPLIVDIALRRGYRLVHMRRQNLVETAISQLVAKHNGVYVASNSLPMDQKMPLSIRHLRYIIAEYRSELAFVTPLVLQYRNAFELEYEKLRTAAQSSDVIEELIKEVIEGSDISFLEYKGYTISKLIKDWRDIVENVSEVEAVFEEVGTAVPNTLT